MTNDELMSSEPETRNPKFKLLWTRLDWAALAILALLVILFHWRLITPDLADRQSYPPGDFSAQFWAFSTFEARELSAGRLPLWNPCTYAGAPFWADVQSAVLYPFSLLTLLLSGLAGGFSLFALELEAIFHFWLGGTFMYLFVRRVTQSRSAGFVSALVFTFGGYLTGYPSQQLAVLEVDVWLPLILFFIDRALQMTNDEPETRNPKRETQNITLAGLVWGIALLAGHPQSWMLVGYTFTAYFLFLVFTTRHSSPVIRHLSFVIRRLRQLLLVILIGFGLAAVQLLPAVEYTRLSVRAAGLYDKMAGGFPLVDAIQVLLPGVVSHYSPLYVGVAGLLLAIAALFYARNRFTAFWGLWGALALLISFGGNTFLYSPLYLSAPGFSIFRGQERWAFVVAFSISVLAGYGMKQVSRWAGEQGSRGMAGKSFHSSSLILHPLVSWLLLGAIGLVIAFFYGLNEAGWSVESQFYQLLNRAVFLAIMLALVWLVLRVAKTIKHKWLTMALGVLIVFDLFSVNWQLNLDPQPPEWHTQKPAVVAAIEADAADSNDLFRVYNEFQVYDNYGVPFEMQDLWGASPLRLARYDAFLSPPMRIERAWELLNVKYVISWRNELYAPSSIIYQEPAPDGTTYVHRLKKVAPRAWIVHQAEQVPADEMVARLTEPGFDFERVVLVEEPVSRWAGEPVGGEAGERIEVVSFLPGRIVLQVDTDADGLLVLSQIFYHGWQAAVDGVAAPVIPADYVLQALPVSAGAHKVVLKFTPKIFYFGALTSLLTLLGSAFLYFRGAVRK